MESFSIARIWYIFISFLPHIIITGICIYFLIHKRNLSSVFLFAGSFITLLSMAVFEFIIYPIIISEDIFTGHSKSSLYANINSIFHLIAQLSFAVGLFLLINEFLSLKKKEQSETDKNQSI